MTSRPFTLNCSDWMNKDHSIRKPGPGKQGLRINRDYMWRVNGAGDRLCVAEDKRDEFARLLRIETRDGGPFNGCFEFPWLMTCEPEAAVAAAERTIDFRIYPDPKDANLLYATIHPFGKAYKLMLIIQQFGNVVELVVQRKLPPCMDEFGTPLFTAGPQLAQHWSGENAVESSGPVNLGRQLARSGSHSYLSDRDGDAPLRYVSLDFDDLVERGDADSSSLEAHSVLFVKLHLAPDDERATEAMHTKRKACFSESPRRRDRREQADEA